MRAIFAVATAISFVGSTVGFVGFADAAFLEWSKFEVKTSSEKVCMRFASDVARQKNLQKIRVIPIEVAGTRGNVYVSMTCVGRDNQHRAIAMVMTVSDDNGAAIATRDEISAALKGIICIDSCN